MLQIIDFLEFWSYEVVKFWSFEVFGCGLLQGRGALLQGRGAFSSFFYLPGVFVNFSEFSQSFPGVFQESSETNVIPRAY